MDFSDYLVGERKCSTDGRFLYHIRCPPANPVSFRLVLPLFSYPDAARITRRVPGDGSSAPESTPADPTVGVSTHAFDEGDWDSANSPSAGDLFGPGQRALYNLLRDVGKEPNLLVSCNLLRLLRLIEDGLPFRSSTKNQEA